MTAPQDAVGTARGRRIVQLADPVDDTDAANKRYVDENAGGGGSYTGPFTIYGLRWQRMDMSGDPPAAGTFKLSYGGVESTAIAFNANNTAVAAALESIPALTGKVTVTNTNFPTGFSEIAFDASLSPFELLVVSNNSLGVADPAIYVAGNANTDLLTPEAGDVIEDFVISVPEAFGAGAVIYFAPEDGETDWPEGLGGAQGLAVDQSDGGDNWTVPSTNEGPQSFHSVALATAAAQYLDTGGLGHASVRLHRSEHVAGDSQARLPGSR